MSATMKDLALITCIATVLLAGNLGGTSLWDEDEPRNARCAVEMYQSGNYIVPTFNGELRSHKPILLYWCMLASYEVFGVSEFSARLPSAIFAVGTVLCVWQCGLHLGGRRFARSAALILASSLMFVVASRAATPDSVLIFWMTAAITFFVRSLNVASPFPGYPARSQDFGFLNGRAAFIGFYCCLGMAMLAKGPIGFLLPMAIIGMFLLIQDDRYSEVERDVRESLSAPRTAVATILRWFHPMRFLRTLGRMRPLTGLLISLLVAGPWYVAVGIETEGEWLRGFFLEHNIGRATRAMEGHSGPFLVYYLVAVLVGFFPWSVFLIPSFMEAWRQRDRTPAQDALLILSSCWIGVTVLLFSLASTKLPSYITPGYPGLAFPAAWFLHYTATNRSSLSSFWYKLSLSSATTIGFIISLAGLWALPRYFVSDMRIVAPFAVFAAGAAFALIQFGKKRFTPSTYCYLGTSLVFVVAIFQVGAPAVSAVRGLPDVLAKVAPGHNIATYGCVRSSWVYYADQTVPRLADITGAGDFLASDQGNILVVTATSRRELETANVDTEVVATAPFFPKLDEEIFLLRGRRAATKSAIVNVSFTVNEEPGDAEEPVRNTQR